MKKQIQHPNFAAEIKAFVEACCRQRLMLLRQGKSQSHNPRMYDIAIGLQNDIKMVQVDVQAASFLKRHASDILQLLPGQHCKGIAKRVEKFNQLYYKSQKILS